MTSNSKTPTPVQPLIRLQDIQKSFLSDELETRALDEVSLEIRSGEFLAVSGPSGCGKSSLLAILGLLDSPSAGHYLLNGQRVEQLDSRAPRPAAQPPDRFRFSSLQFDRRPHGRQQRGLAAELPLRNEPRRAPRARGRGLGPGGHGAPCTPLPGAALGRPTAPSRMAAASACCCRARLPRLTKAA